MNTTKLLLAAAVFLCVSCATTRRQNVDDFFRYCMDDLMRHNPDHATMLRYFSGEEQDRLERLLTPQTLEQKKASIDLARKGLKELKKFDRARMTDVQLVSAEVFEWSMNSYINQEPFLDYGFPLNQLNGANVGLVTILTVGHSLATERDAPGLLFGPQ
jgi:uncharacterized protein (DUF885 family)